MSDYDFEYELKLSEKEVLKVSIRDDSDNPKSSTFHIELYDEELPQSATAFDFSMMRGEVIRHSESLPGAFNHIYKHRDLISEIENFPFSEGRRILIALDDIHNEGSYSV